MLNFQLLCIIYSSIMKNISKVLDLVKGKSEFPVLWNEVPNTLFLMSIIINLEYSL